MWNDFVFLPNCSRVSREFFGADMSSISIVESDKPFSYGAFAFASGDEIHIWPGAARNFFRSSGLPLLVHEIAHCLQQRGGRQACASERCRRKSFIAKTWKAKRMRRHSPFIRGTRSFHIEPSSFECGSPILQRIETATLRAWLGDAEFNRLKGALGANFAVLAGREPAGARTVPTGHRSDGPPRVAQP